MPDYYFIRIFVDGSTEDVATMETELDAETLYASLDEIDEFNIDRGPGSLSIDFDSASLVKTIDGLANVSSRYPETEI